MLWLIMLVVVLIGGALFGRAYERHLDVLSGPWIQQRDEEPKSP
jgi:hypothetical protein